MEHREIRESFVGRSIFLAGFVIHHRNLELLIGSLSLHQGVAAIDEGLPVPVPVHHKRGNSQGFRVANLTAYRSGILRGIADGDVLGMSEPGFVQGNCFR